MKPIERGFPQPNSAVVPAGHASPVAPPPPVVAALFVVPALPVVPPRPAAPVVPPRPPAALVPAAPVVPAAADVPAVPVVPAAADVPAAPVVPAAPGLPLSSLPAQDTSNSGTSPTTRNERIEVLRLPFAISLASGGCRESTFLPAHPLKQSHPGTPMRVSIYYLRNPERVPHLPR